MTAHTTADSAASTDPDRLVSLVDAAALTGLTPEALRLRVRRGKLRAVKGNDGRTMVKVGDLADLTPGRPTATDHDHDIPDHAEAVDHLHDELAATVADLTAERIGTARLTAERDAEKRRADDAEARARVAGERLDKIETELREARRPLWERVIRTVRGG